ncbi:MAG: rhodanese-like domain-containing protein [Gammaproteobacteria bacterium]|nr:rhodanese-like domain-containing protein [Gammaproteobacteria bacterium]
MNNRKLLNFFAPLGLVAAIATSPVVTAGNITAELPSITVSHHGKEVVISRTDAEGSTIPKAYVKTDRHCPPFCIQPMTVVNGVETVGELELLGYLKQIHRGDRKVMVIDSRTPDWIVRGTIPGSVNVPWSKINLDHQGSFNLDIEAEGLDETLEQFGVRIGEGERDFRNAKTLVLFCNGAWCPQSATNIKTLVRLGYPAYKLKWYRGGMQDWVSLGLTTVNY